MKKVIDSSCGIILFGFLFSFSIYGLSVYGNFVLSNTSYIFCANNSLALLQSSWFNFYDNFRLICLTFITELTSLNRIENVTCENCGTEITKRNLARHKKNSSAIRLYCTQCPNFSTKSRAKMNYQISKKQYIATAKVVHRCKICDKSFHSFHLLRELKPKKRGAHRSSGAVKVNNAHVMGDIDDKSLKDFLETCKHFLVDSEIENERRRVYISAMNTMDPKRLLEKLVVFDSLKCGAN